MKINLTIRGYGDGAQIFKQTVSVEETALDSLIPELATEHAGTLQMYSRHMIEIEFLDEPNPLERFFRFGTDPAGMVRPIAIELGEPKRQ